MALVKAYILRFQSTPPVSGRRCPTYESIGASTRKFQSTPPVSGRRCVGGLVSQRHDQIVSIHAPRFRGAMRRPDQRVGPVAGGSSHACCFNPRPPFPGGDALRNVAYGRQCGVSIHAPRFREAMRGWRSICRLSWRSFNPRPPFPGGDACSRSVPHSPRICFNPRPPFPGGDALSSSMWVLSPSLFQSTPPVSGRRCAAKASSTTTPSQFQSTPPVSGRRCVFIGTTNEEEYLFQSTPPVSGRRC